MDMHRAAYRRRDMHGRGERAKSLAVELVLSLAGAIIVVLVLAVSGLIREPRSVAGAHGAPVDPQWTAQPIRCPECSLSVPIAAALVRRASPHHGGRLQ